MVPPSMNRAAGLATACITSLLVPLLARAEDPIPDAQCPREDAACLAPRSTVAPRDPANDPAKLQPPPIGGRKIRSGLVVALSLDNAIGSAFGYPNDSKLLGDDRYYGRTPVLPGFGFTLAVSGALTEYLNVGVYLASSGFANDVWSVSSAGIGMRFDVFPLTYSSNQWLRHWAFYGLAGVGQVSATYEAPGRNVAELTGTQSQLGLGSFYEFRFGSIGIGPDTRFDAIFSNSTDRLAYQVGFRLSFYPSRLF